MSTWVVASLRPTVPHVGDVERPIEGLASEQHGARVTWKDGPRVLDGEPLVDERADESAGLLGARIIEKIPPLRAL